MFSRRSERPKAVNVVESAGASPYTLGFKAKRCRHLTEDQLLRKAREMAAELQPLAQESVEAARALSMYQQWANLLALGRGAGYRYIDTHHDELLGLTEAVKREVRAKRDARERAALDRDMEGADLVAAALATFSGARVGAWRERSDWKQGSLI